MKSFVILVAVLGACSANEVLHAKWSSYKAAHGKSYHEHDEPARLETFSANLRHIDEHNAKFERGEVSYKLGLTPLTDMTQEEIRSKMLGAVVDERARAELNATQAVMMPNAPSYVDWRSIVTPVKNQQSCGSCYTFSTVGVLESILKKRYNYDYDLSEQFLVDCSFGKLNWNFNFGCGGGDAGMTLGYVIKTGVPQEYEYTYQNVQGSCRMATGSVSFSNMQLKSVPANDEYALANALASYGPIAITLNGENRDFGNYVGGIYNNPSCPTQINHAVLLVGYGSQGGMDYWLIKNSWGPTWGEQGYMRMAKGYNRCGIVSQGSYFLV